LDHDERHLHQREPQSGGAGADKAYEFAWSFNPVPIKGATGHPGNSVAIASASRGGRAPGMPRRRPIYTIGLGCRKFTPEERRSPPYVTNLDGPVFALVNLPES